MPINLPGSAEYLRFLPETVLTIAGVLLMLLEALHKEDRPSSFSRYTLLCLAAALLAAVGAAGYPGAAFSNMLVVDGFASFFRVLVIGVGILTVLSSREYLHRERAGGGDYYALILFSLVGQCIMASSNELIMIFIGLEISSIASYILAGYLRDDPRNNESALKYFLLGSFATAFLLYGVAWIYGLTGSTNLTVIRHQLISSTPPPMEMAAFAAGLILVGLAFKVSAAPFHIWAPDVYQGAPAPVSGYLSVGPKAAAFAILLRVFMTGFGSLASRWEPILWVCALLTMFVGNLAALQQSNIKRMLAYSSIAHAGYVLVAVTAHSSVGSTAVMFYLAAYAFTNLGAFAVITYFAGKGEKYVSIDDLAGLGQRQPGLAAMLTLFLLSLIGVPLTGGFFGKFYIFKAALDANLVWLTVLGLLNSAIAAYYYLRILVVMYMKDPKGSTKGLQPAGLALNAALAIAAIGTLVLGIFPDWVLSIATRAALR